MPAKNEGFGIVYLEAAASGLPVIGGRDGGVSEALLEGKSGVLIEPHDAGAVTIAVLNLLRNPEKRQAMGIAGRTWVEQEMNWDRAANKLLPFLR